MTLNDVRCFLLDMDGTFYLGGELIEGSLEFIERVRATGRDYLFLTNNSSHNAAFYVDKLARMGLRTDRGHVLTSGEATCEILRERYPGKRAFLLGNEFLAEEFREFGAKILDISWDLHASPLRAKEVTTEYEDKFREWGIAIKYLKAKL